MLHPRIVLIAGKFAREVTHTAVWLRERDIDIRLVEVRAWLRGADVLVSFQQRCPVPDLDEFTLAPARASTASVAAKVAQRTRNVNLTRRLVDSDALPVGTTLTIKPAHGVTRAQAAQIDTWLEAHHGSRKAIWTNDGGAPLRWDFGAVKADRATSSTPLPAPPG